MRESSLATDLLAERCKATMHILRDSERDTLRNPGIRITLWLASAIPLAAVIMPCLYLFLWAFWGTATVGITNSTPSLQWFSQVARSQDWRDALWYSTWIGILVSASGTFAVTIHSYSAHFFGRSVAVWTQFCVLLPYLIPGVVFGLSLRLVGPQLGAPESILLFAGHLAFVLPIQYFIVENAQERVSRDMLFAGNTLGAGHSINYIHVYLPVIRPTILNSFVIGFFLSFDELVIAAMVLGRADVTVAKKLWDQATKHNTPEPAVIAVLLFVTYGVGLASITGFGMFKKSRNRKIAI